MGVCGCMYDTSNISLPNLHFRQVNNTAFWYNLKIATIVIIKTYNTKIRRALFVNRSGLRYANVISVKAVA